MPALLAIVLGRVAQWVSWGIIIKLVAALGVGFVVYTGLNALMATTLQEIIGDMGAAGAQVVAVMGMLNIDRAITMVFSAYTARLTMTATKRLIFGGGGTGSG